MPLPWVIVGGTGYDVEEVLDPDTRDMDCPSCEKHVRFIERQLVKNLRVFGVPLVGVERGRRVFECPRCKTCVERGDDEPVRNARAREREPMGGARATADALEQLLSRAEDEVWLWRRRAETAERAGETSLAAEALELATRAERERDRLRAELKRAGRKPASAGRGATPAIVARPAPGGGAIPAVDDEFAALKARVAQRAVEGDRHGEDEAESESVDTAPVPAASHAAEATDAGDGASPEAESAADVEAEFEALRSRMRGGAPARDSGDEPPGGVDYEALKRELSLAPGSREPASDPREVPPATPSGSAPEPAGGGSDPLADLKRKLRKG